MGRTNGFMVSDKSVCQKYQYKVDAAMNIAVFHFKAPLNEGACRDHRLKYCFFIFFFFFSLILGTACQSDVIKLQRNHAEFRDKDYFEQAILQSHDLSSKTRHYLKSYFTGTGIDNDHREIIRRLSMQQDLLVQGDLLEIISDLCWNQTKTHQHPPTENLSYCVAAAFYSYKYLNLKNDADSGSQYDPSHCQMILRYNQAISAIFRYLQQWDLLNRQSFRLPFINGQEVEFDISEIHLTVPPDSIISFELCSDYVVKNIDYSLSFGIGTPLLVYAGVPESGKESAFRYPERFVLPATFLLHFYGDSDMQNNHVLQAKAEIVDTANQDMVYVGNNRIPLASDFTTVFCAQQTSGSAKDLVDYVLHPIYETESAGFYLTMPYQPEKIPIVFIHGLLSSPETWKEMVLQLYNDPHIQKHYQFLFYKYSSGNPVLASAAVFRNGLNAIQQEVSRNPEAMETFRKMILIGHSMGGLITRTMVQQNEAYFVEKSSGKSWQDLQKILSPDDLKLAENLIFPHPDFVSRAIFIACPHRGSEKAQWGVSKQFAKLIRLPQNIFIDSVDFLLDFAELKKDNHDTDWKKLTDTGIDNLDPENFFIQTLSDSPFVKIPCHSIIGNRHSAGIPAGSDGIVDYSSAHLDHVDSEIIVKSGHSVQKTLPAIREVKRILYMHLKDN